MIDFSLSEEQKMLRTTAHQFALEKIRPVATEIDRNPNPGDFPWQLYKEASELGFPKILVSEKDGGLGMGLVNMALATEELAWGDAGFANTIGTVALNLLIISLAGTEYQKEKFLRPFIEDKTGKLLISALTTEPEGGCEIFSPLAGPKSGTRTKAVKDGKFWVINGAKSWSTNAGISHVYMVTARTNPEGPNLTGNTMFIVPADTPGLTFGRIENKMGRRTQYNREVFLENVRVPEENVVGKIGGAIESIFEHRPAFPRAGHLYLGASTVGLARAAYEEAVKFSGERVIWGKPIRQHQLIAKKLVDMRLKIESMRAFVWKMAWALDHQDQPELCDGLMYLGGEAVKYFATEQVVDLIRDAMQVFGAVGYTKELSLEKWMRDAIGLSVCGGANEMHCVVISEKL